jgi:hypothetical protein
MHDGGGIDMHEHLQRALIEVYFAMAEFRHDESAPLNVEQFEETTLILQIIRANLEKLLRSDLRLVRPARAESDAPSIGQC